MKTWTELPEVLSIAGLSQAYRDGELTPTALVDMLWQRLESAPARGIWISRLPFERLLAYAAALAEQAPDDLPLYGIPFAIKDNIDLADLPTTAACPAYAYQPQQSAFVVQQLIAAGAIPVGKTNLDQFATGLVGTRSPYGVCRNSFDPDYIAGGSSSGSCAATASIQITSPAAPARVRRSRWRPVWPALRWAPTPPAPAECRPRSTTWSASNRRGAC